MLQLVKRSVFIGLGLAAMNAAAIKKVGAKLAEESKLSEAEGKKLVEDLIEQSKKSKSDLKLSVQNSVKESISEMNIATSDDIESINIRLDKIEGKTKSSTKSESRLTKPTKSKTTTK